MHATPRNVIVGVRPEHFEDAALIDGYERISALTFPVTVDLVESLGADKYVYFTAPGDGAQSEQLAELAADVRRRGRTSSWQGFPPSPRRRWARRWSWRSTPRSCVVFDADSGVNLTDPARGAGVTQVLDEVRAHLRGHFAAKGADSEPDSASVTFLGVERIDVLQVRPGSTGCCTTCRWGVHAIRWPTRPRSPSTRCAVRGPRSCVRLRDDVPTPGLARSRRGARRDPGRRRCGAGRRCADRPGVAAVGAAAGLPPFSAVLLGPSDIADLALDPPREPVTFLTRRSDHRERGRVGATQGRRRDAGGVAPGRRRRLDPTAAPPSRASRSERSEPVVAPEIAVQQPARRTPSPAAPPDSPSVHDSSGMCSKFMP